MRPCLLQRGAVYSSAGRYNAGMMRILYAPPDVPHPVLLPADEVSDVLASGLGLLWVDLAGEPTAEYERLLTQTFGFHPLAVDDALNEIHVPKVDDWDSYLYMVLQTAVYNATSQALQLPELDIFIGRNYMVTYHTEPIPALELVWQSCQRPLRWLAQGVDHLLYRLIDAVVDNLTAVMDTLEDELEQIESEIFLNAHPQLLSDLFDLKRVVQQLRRALALQRDVVGKLARDDYPTIDPQDRVYFRDVYDHLLRLYDLSDNLRDLTIVALDVYLSVVNNRMNDIMKMLTVITTMFMPLSFLTGFFGMNFFQPVVPLAGWTGTAAFVFTLLAMISLPLAMMWWMRRRAWM